MKLQKKEGFFYFVREKKNASDYSLGDIRAMREDSVEISLRRAKFRWAEVTNELLEKLEKGVKANELFPSATNLVGELKLQKIENEQLNSTIEQQLKELQELRDFKKKAESEKVTEKPEPAKSEEVAERAKEELPETPENAVRRVVKKQNN